MYMQKTTDDQEELFDVVDENDRVIGKVRRREASSNKDIIHRSVFVAVFNKKDDLFMQKRSSTKDTDPLCWDLSSSGHVLSGQSYVEAAKRELWEELGVKLPLVYIDKFIIRYPKETEMVTVFKASYDGPFILHPQEISGGMFFSKRGLKKASRNGDINLAYGAKCVLNHMSWFV